MGGGGLGLGQGVYSLLTSATMLEFSMDATDVGCALNSSSKLVRVRAFWAVPLWPSEVGAVFWSGGCMILYLLIYYHTTS